TVEARGQPDETLRMAGEVLEVDTRLVVITLEVGVGGQPAEIAVARPIPGEEDQVERLGVGATLPFGHRAPRDVGLVAADRLDLARAAGLVEGDRAVERPVIRPGE